MSYVLGVDLGTTFTACAVARDGRAEICSLGNRSASVPSVVFLREDETILTGEAAERRALSDPGRVAREFKRRVGDPTPIILGGTPYSAEALMGKMLRWTVEAVSEREGGAPERIAATHPANWGPYKKDLFEQAIRLADLEGVHTLTEPEAAATYYASNERVDPGTIVAVYDLGGGTFDATVLRKHDSGFVILGKPEGIERLGGIDLDEAVFSHVDRALDGALTRQDLSDQRTVSAVVRVRQECVASKEALSTDTDTVIPVMLPDLQTEIRLTRSEFEAMIRPVLADTIAALRRALRSAPVEPTDVDRVLLVGGSSRIPLVAELVSAELGRPVAVDAHPKYAVPLGAALAAAPGVAEGSGDEPRTHDLTVPAAVAAAKGQEGGVATAPSLRLAAAPSSTAPTVASTDQASASANPRTTTDVADADLTPPPPPARRARPTWLYATAAAGLLAIVATAFLVLRPQEGATDSSPRATTAPEADPAVLATAAPTVAPSEVTPPPGTDFFVRIDDIAVEDGSYIVDFTTFGYEPQLGSGNKHIHFFFDAVQPDDAGVPGQGPWQLYPTSSASLGASPFTLLGVSDRPSGSTQMCALVANSDHSVIASTGTCFDLP